MSGWYWLNDDHSISRAPDAGDPNFHVYSAWLYGRTNGIPNRNIKVTNITDDVFISTVFLGLDHGFGNPIPIVFETLVFGGPLDNEGARYSFYQEAIEGHEHFIRLHDDFLKSVRVQQEKAHIEALGNEYEAIMKAEELLNSHDK